jgi:hypothetical protein
MPRALAHLYATMSEAMHPLRLPANLQTTNLGVGGSNPSERANDFNDLASTRRSRFEFKTAFRTVNFFRTSGAPRVGQT